MKKWAHIETARMISVGEKRSEVCFIGKYHLKLFNRASKLRKKKFWTVPMGKSTPANIFQEMFSSLINTLCSVGAKFRGGLSLSFRFDGFFVETDNKFQPKIRCSV